MNRRALLKALGGVAVGSLAHEQLSWLVRQPVSVLGNMPVIISFSISNIKKEDTISVFSLRTDERKDFTEKHLNDKRIISYLGEPKEVLITIRSPELNSAYTATEVRSPDIVSIARIKDRAYATS